MNAITQLKTALVGVTMVGILLLMTATSTRAQVMEPMVTDTAVITTSYGSITFVLYGIDAPRTVENFTKLAEKGFYRGLLVHRVVPGNLIQAGDPKTRDTAQRAQWGTGGESSFGRDFEDELNPNAPSYRRGYLQGTLAMANRKLPNTNSSQFFITVKDLAIPKNYTIFGRVIAGFEVVQKIEAVPLSDRRRGIPVDPVTILDVKVIHVKR